MEVYWEGFTPTCPSVCGHEAHCKGTPESLQETKGSSGHVFGREGVAKKGLIWMFHHQHARKAFMKDRMSAVRVPCRRGTTPRASHGQGELSEQELIPPWQPHRAVRRGAASPGASEPSQWNWGLRLESLTRPTGAQEPHRVT